MFLTRFLLYASPLDGICASLPHGSPTLPWGLYHMPVAGVGAGMPGAASHGIGKIRKDTHNLVWIKFHEEFDIEYQSEADWFYGTSSTSELA